MRTTKNAEAVIYLHNSGFRALVDGQVLGPDGLPRKQRSDKYGYMVFTGRSPDRKRCSRRYIWVHQLVALQKYGEVALARGIEVRHRDGDRRNNHPDNILIGTHSQNMLDIPAEKRRQMAEAGASVVRKLTPEKVRSLREDRASGMTYEQLMLKYGMSKSGISYAVRGLTYAQ